MARKKSIKIPPSVIKGVLIIVITLATIIGIGTFIFNVFVDANIFKVKVVKIESGLSFINRQDIERFKGKSIFKVNLKDIQQKLSSKYPQMAEIRVIKDYPDQISIEAKKRLPFAQIQYRSGIIMLDQRGFVLSESSKTDDKLPFIRGFKLNYLRVGLPIRGEQMASALEVLQYYRIEKALNAYPLVYIDVTNLSEIYLHLTNNIDVKIDRDNIEQKIKLLGFMLSRSDLELNQIKYIDLRFKEPILGQNEVLNKKNF
jgi:cell division septal protein FtsQ